MSSIANTSSSFDNIILILRELALPSTVLLACDDVNASVAVITSPDVVPAESIICTFALPEPDILLK